ncbi:MAG TPA: hypothetical protein VK636_19005 [Gemmatimonadaceae bacterium]|nr:hypothetical protein [Gemmatimonadaceae bacterium]
MNTLFSFVSASALVVATTLGAQLNAQTTRPGSPNAVLSAATAVVRRGLDAIGGEARWRAVHTMTMQTRSTAYSIGDSDWFDGPYSTWITLAEEWRDLDRSRRSTRVVGSDLANNGTTLRRAVASLNANVVFMPSDSGEALVAKARPDSLDFLLATERVLFTALAGADLRVERDTVVRLVATHVVSFHVGRTPVRLFFEAESGFLRMVEARRVFPTDMFWNAWGDVTERVRFSNWDVMPTGVLYPSQIDVERNGRPQATVRYDAVRINALPPAGVFEVAAEKVRSLTCGFSCLAVDSLPLGFGSGPGQSKATPASGPHEIGAGVVQIGGGWNTTLVRQADGVVVIEAPMSAGYASRVLDEAARRFPGVPVKAVVSTTDYWWHVAGVREYVARGIPIYILDHNVRVVEQRARAPHMLLPDSLARAPKSPIIRPVTRRMSIGSGDNRIELIPFRSQALDRMMMAYLPGKRLLYTAEGVQIYDFGVVNPEYILETVAAVARERLTPERFIGMHMPVTPWSRVTAVVDSLRAAAR